MRISDDRYDRDRVQLDLALRMMSHGARTRTIGKLTGLTQDRLRKMSRAYQMQRHKRQEQRVRLSAQRPMSLLKSQVLAFEASSLAGILLLLGLIPDCTAPAGEPQASRAARSERLCEAFEMFRTLLPGARLSFEHAHVVLQGLQAAQEITLLSCARCGRAYLAALVPGDGAECACIVQRLNLPRRRRRPLRGETPRKRLAKAGSTACEAALSEQSVLGKRHAGTITDDEVVEHLYVHERQ